LSRYIHKSHNVSVLMYHIVCPTKYRRVVIDEKVDNTIKETCIEISKRYEIEFIEIGTEGDHVHFLVQSVPKYSPTQIVTIIKSIIAREVFKKNPIVKKKLWGGEFWTEGYYISTVGMHGNEDVIKNYVKNQGNEKEYIQLHYQKPSVQLTLF
jgi:putative transposase